jgi:hypothetical protein
MSKDTLKEVVYMAFLGLGYARGPKRGQHYELARFAVNKLKRVNLLVKGQSESDFEFSITGHLMSSPKLRQNGLLARLNKDEVGKITEARLFGFGHRPDLAIGPNGTAIEIKVISSGQSLRDTLGQALVYRMHYRFVILVLVDQTADRKVVELCRSKRNQEFTLLSELADTMNIFTIVGPLSQSKNISFCETINSTKAIQPITDSADSG